MKKRKLSIKKCLIFLFILIIVLLLVLLITYKSEISAVSTDTSPKTFVVRQGDNYFSLGERLKENNLIKSTTFYKLYLSLNKPKNTLVSGTYELNEAMSVPEIIKILSDKSNQSDSGVKITFREGLNVRQIAKIVERKAGIPEDNFIATASDKEYVKSLEPKYWFLTDNVLNDQIYYALEGYLFPDTYTFNPENLTSKDIIETMLDNTAKKLEAYKTQIESGTYNVHQILTLASLIELEAKTDEDRAMVSGVFYNRLNNDWSLGSDVTTYYAARKNLSETLTTSDLNDCNGYNTRCTSMRGLPVGPIDNPSISSINAALNPTQNSYYYFVADTNKKVYFTRNANEHEQIIQKLKDEGKWAA